MTRTAQPIEGTPIEPGEQITPGTFAAGVKDVISSTPSSSTPKPPATEGVVAEAPTTASSPAPTEVQQVKRPETAVNPASGAPFTIHSNINIIRHLRMLVYGEYGSGKTLLSGTAVGVEEMRDVLMISAELGELTLYDPDSQEDIPYNLIDIVHVDNYSTAARIHEFLKLHCSVRDLADQGNVESRANLMKLQRRLMPHLPDPERLRLYRTVLIDTITEIEIYCMQQLMGINDTSLLDEEMDSPEWAQYNKQRMMIHRLIRGFRNLPMNCIFACQRQFKENEQKRRIYGPQMTGKMSAEVQGFMDVVGHLIVGDSTPEEPIPPRRMIIQPGPRHAAKNRFRRYKEPHFDNPTIPSIVQAVGLKEVWEKYGTYIPTK